MTKTKVPSQADVSALAGVSRSTVSQVLNNKAGFSVPAGTRQRVLDAAQELGYVPNVAARNLRMQKTHTIGVIIQDITNPFYPAFVRGVQDVAEAAGYDLLIYNTDSKEARERHFLEVMRHGRVDGVVGVFFYVGDEDFQALTARGLPIALLGPAPLPGEPDDLVDHIILNDQLAAQHAVQHLLDRGYRRVAVVTGSEVLQGRVQGYLDAMTQAGLHDRVSVLRGPDLTEESGYAVGQPLFTGPNPPEAIFAVNDLLALGLLRASREVNLRVPEDLALMGFDDIPAAQLVTPTLSSVRQFQQRIGRRCAELLLERLTGQQPDPTGRTEEMPFELVLRHST